MDSTNVASLILWLVIIAIIVVVIVWIVCACQNNEQANVKQVEVVSFNAGKEQQEQSGGQPENSMETPFSQGDNLAYYPFGKHNEEHASAHHANFPTEEDPAARFPQNPDNGVQPYNSVCGTNAGDQYGYSLDVNHLMPASWRGNEACGSESVDETQWAAYAPSKAAFDSYITTAGSARLGVNTRNPQSRKIGLPNLVADAVRSCGTGGAPVPIGAENVLFNDSDMRQSAVYEASGKYPVMTWC